MWMDEMRLGFLSAAQSNMGMHPTCDTLPIM
jgi:hypothetical protein